MIYDKKSYDIMKYIEDTLQTPIVGIKTDDFEAMEKVSLSFLTETCECWCTDCPTASQTLKNAMKK